LDTITWVLTSLASQVAHGFNGTTIAIAMLTDFLRLRVMSWTGVSCL
jgi:hypothetical protein